MTAGAAARRHAGVALFAVAAALLSACTTLAPLPPSTAAETLSGRLAIRVDADGASPARSFAAAFDLRGDAARGNLGLSTPLGSMLAQARWDGGRVELATPQGRRDYADLDALTRDVLGESVPVEAWFDWLRGRPWPGAPSSDVTPAGFEQLGWRVDLARFGNGNVVATRLQPAPSVAVRIQLDGGA